MPIHSMNNFGDARTTYNVLEIVQKHKTLLEVEESYKDALNVVRAYRKSNYSAKDWLMEVSQDTRPSVVLLFQNYVAAKKMREAFEVQDMQFTTQEEDLCKS